jgi:pyruvate ferredoxin oxidoreductase alpha subunit
MKSVLNTKYQILNTKLALTGGASAALALKQIEPEVMAVYPITPQTPIIETYAKYQSDGEVNTEIIQVESEHSAMSACVGASAAGARTVTATSSQGLALMNEILYVASGMRLPILMLVSARALGAPINIHGDHSDVMGARDAGWIQLFSEDAQEVYDNTIIGMKLAETVGLPVMVIMDGFNTSHSVENLEILHEEEIKEFVGEYRPEQFLLDVENPVTFGPLALQNSYFDFKVDQEQAMRGAGEEYLKIARKFQNISGREKGYFEKYKTEDAEHILVLSGSTAGTSKDVIDRMRESGKKVGLLKINLFRPLPAKEIAQALKGAKNIAIMDRALSSGTMPPLFTEITGALNRELVEKISAQSLVYGLGGREIFATDIEKVLQDLVESDVDNEIRFVGLNKK